MMSTQILFMVCSFAGLILVVGSLILLWRHVIFLNEKSGGSAAGKSATPDDGSDLEVSKGALKFRTHSSVLVMFFFGAFLLIFPVYYHKTVCPDPLLHTTTFPQMVKVTAPIKSPVPLKVYAIVAEQSDIQNQATLNIPFAKNIEYRIILANGSTFFPQDSFSLGDNPAPQELRAMNWPLAAEVSDSALNKKVKPDAAKEEGFK